MQRAALGSRGLGPHVSSGTSISEGLEELQVDRWEMEPWLVVFLMGLDIPGAVAEVGLAGDNFLAGGFLFGLSGAGGRPGPGSGPGP